MIDDIGNLFANSKGKDIFSAKGLSALADFPYWYSGLFYTALGITAFWLYSVINFNRKKYREQELLLAITAPEFDLEALLGPKVKKTKIIKIKKEKAEIEEHSETVSEISEVEDIEEQSEEEDSIEEIDDTVKDITIEEV